MLPVFSRSTYPSGLVDAEITEAKIGSRRSCEQDEARGWKMGLRVVPVRVSEGPQPRTCR